VFKKTILAGQYFDTYWPVNRWTSQYPILTYTTWRDLNRSQPHISIRGITKWFTWRRSLRKRIGAHWGVGD